MLLFQAKLAGGHGGGALGQLLPPAVLTAAEAAWRQSVSSIDAMKVIAGFCVSASDHVGPGLHRRDIAAPDSVL